MAKKAKTDDAPIRVRVKLDYMGYGYYGEKRRRPGDVFTVEPGQFSDRWMERVPADTPEHTTGPQDSLSQEHRRIMAEQSPALVPTGDSDPLGDAAT
jgi:hypothetical protein